MATILFIMMPESGHLNASYKLASALAARGHRVVYSEPPYIAAAVGAKGFEFVPLLADYFPPGFDAAQSAGASWFEVLRSVLKLETEADMRRAFGILRRELQALAAHARPDLLLIDGLLRELAATAHELRLPCALINTALYDPSDDPLQVANAPAFAHVLSRLPALFLCPQEFDFPRQRGAPHHYYVEASVDLEREEADFPWELLDAGKRLIYCSLGSQSFLYGERQQVLGKLVEAVGRRAEWQMVLAAGGHLGPADFEPLPPNVLVVKSAPQLALLKRAALMITHGGLNTIKECILSGVPMIVFPMQRDQPRNAARVAYHGLGLVGNLQFVTVEQATALIEQVEQAPAFREKVEAMRSVFLAHEESGRGVQVVESLLARAAVN
jgi:UDP:flavonoid glycosyltransferase YjiC (YdhE family)